MTTSSITIALSLLTVMLYSCSQEEDTDLILNEQFDKNEIGWVEENTDFHNLEIKDGKYLITSIDTTYSRTSGRPLDNSFVLSLPKKYEIETSAEFITGNKHNEYGMILLSQSLEYVFSVYDKGTISVYFRDLVLNKDTTLLYLKNKNDLVKKNTSVKLKVIVDGKKYKYAVNDEIVYEGTLQTKQWNEMRLFASTSTLVGFDYLTIKKTKERN